MLKQIMFYFVLICAVTLVSGMNTAASADWRGPVVIPQLPQQPPPPLRMPQPLPNGYLEPATKNIQSAPQVVTGNGQGSYNTGSGHDDSRDAQTKNESHPAQETVKEPVPPPVSQSPASEAQQQVKIDAEKQATPASEPSNSKTPWLLAGGVVVAAFILGRRSR